MIGWFATFVKQFIAISQVTKEDLLKLGVSENKIVVKNPPVDCTRFDFTIRPSGLRASFFVDERAPLFGIFGILEKWKGHRVFLEAAQEVLDAVPGSIAFVVGDTPGGDRAYREELDAQCHRLGISKRVIFTGFREDVPELMAMLDVVVHASIIPEPFGKVVIEAMAMRKPVVATAAGGPTEIIRPGHDGLLVPPRDPRPMAECIIRLLRDRELAAKIGSAGLETVRARYGVTEYVNAVEGIYDSVMGCS
jgi:glycosyltransferase involved in cell wall biosynthesis